MNFNMSVNWKANAALFLGAQALTIFGSQAVQYAILWHITIESQSGTMMTIFSAALFLPMFFISPFAGVWADRFNKKYIINIADAAVAAASLTIAIFLFLGFESVWMLLACAVARSLGQGVQNPAVGAFIPEITPQSHLTKINGIQNGVQSASMLAAPMAAGALISVAPLETIFLLDVVTAAAGISILLFFVKSSPKNMDGVLSRNVNKKIDYLYDLKEGLKYINNHKFILRLIIISIIFFIFISPAALLTTLQVTRNFGGEVWRLTVVEIFFLSGMIAGGGVIAAWGGFKNRVYTMAFSTALCGAGSIGLGIAPVFSVYLVIMCIMGFTIPLYNTPVMVLLQTKVKSSYMARVLAVFNMVFSIMTPAGMIFFGPLADVVSIDALLIASGIIIAILSPLFILSKSLREAGESGFSKAG